MRSDRVLRVCMQALVLLNLVFVQMTEAAGLHWLAPLYVLALGAPLLERFRERLAYRLLWNAGVVGFFLLLLRHALRAELSNVLEDGLVLAVLCQVHLLNNLRSEQRPDLLFFNAFLIAIVAGYMSPGVGFPVGFLAFAPAFVIGLQLQSATGDGRVLARAPTRRLVLDGARRAALLLAASLLVFLFWPRDFERKAYFHGRLELAGGGPSRLEVGFSEELVLNRSQPVEASDVPALRVTLIEGRTADVPSLWRGATLAATSGGAWRAMEPAIGRAAAPSDEPWRGQRGRLVRAGSLPSAAPRVEVVRFDAETERLFAPLRARALQLSGEHAGGLLRARLDGTVDTAEAGEVRYELVLAPVPDPQPGGPRPAELAAELEPYVQLPANERVARARELAARLTEHLPPEAAQHELVALLSQHLSRTYTYLAPGTAGAATTLDQFLRGAAGGHCEFFASALATMLRSLGIPSRVVTGYRSTRWDLEGRVLAFGMRDAHAWVEVHDPAAGWYAVDPSPTLVGHEAGAGPWARLRSAARSAWATVTSFDAERRAEFFAWVRSVPARLAEAWRARPVEASLVALLALLAAAGILQRRRARTQPAVRAYRSAVRRSRLRLLPGETPRELLSRARREGLTAARVEELEAATQRHEAERYAA